MPFCWTCAALARHDDHVTFVLALLALWLAGFPGCAASVGRIDIRHDRLVVRVDSGAARAVRFMVADSTRTIAGPDREAPAETARRAAPDAALRDQDDDQAGARIVLDLALPAILAQGDFSADPRRLTLELRTVDDASFARAAADRRIGSLPPFSYGRSVASPTQYRVSAAVPAPSRSLPLPRIYGDDDTRPLVVIDAGHGGFDPGAISPETGLREKDVTLRIATAIRDELVRSGRARVALTREDDHYLVLQERYGIARKMHAALFISIHCDSIEAGEASGATAYTLSEVASDKQAARLAARENKADIISGVNLATTSPDLSSILIDLTQRETMNNSSQFARLLGREAQPLMLIKPNFHRMASLMVLKAPDLPSILFETGYLSNPRDAAFIDSPQGRQAIAQSVRRAVEVHFARRVATSGGDRGG